MNCFVVVFVSFVTIRRNAGDGGIAGVNSTSQLKRVWLAEVTQESQH